MYDMVTSHIIPVCVIGADWEGDWDQILTGPDQPWIGHRMIKNLVFFKILWQT